jgi:predicted nucleic acid-binding protein
MSNDDATTASGTEALAKPRLFIDADVLIAGSASTTGASYILLHLSDLTIIEGIISQQVKVEAERNLREKLPQALPAFRLLVESAVKVVDDPPENQLIPLQGQAHAEDLPLLAAALLHRCHYLVTFNVKHYYPEGKKSVVLRPGEFLHRLRQQLVGLIP